LNIGNTVDLLTGFAVLIFLYAFLIKEVAHRTVVALFFASIVAILDIILKFAPFATLINAINLDTILLLMSMMIIIGVLSETGVFEFIADLIAVKMYTRPYLMIAVLSALTASVSAFIDNVTTVLMISPIVLELSRKLRIDPRPILLSIVFASNIGGTATLIGDPPNILIGTAAHLGFMSFIYNLTPAVIVVFIAYLIALGFLYSSWMREYQERIRSITLKRETTIYVNKLMLGKVLAVLGTVIALFFMEDIFNFTPAVPPLIGAGVLLIIFRGVISIDKALKKVDWTTLVFFAGMFIVIKGIEELGVMRFIANELALVGKEPLILLTLIIWVSAIVSAFIDNIPFVMSMLPVMPELTLLTHFPSTPMYWALSLGGCLGGNGTLVGASANVVVAGLTEKYGYRISFNYFTKYGIAVMLITVSVATAYVLLVYG